MRFLLFPIHPVLWASYPVIALYAANTALVPPGQLAIPLAISIGSAIVVWLAARLTLGDWQRAALVASVAAVGFFLYGHIRNVAGLSSTLTTAVWVPLYVGLILAAGWKRKGYEMATRVANVIGIALVGFLVVSVAGAFGSAKVTSAVSASRGAAIPKERPDIYYIILDGYGRSDALKRTFGLSIDPFVESLRERGFRVASEARTNYIQTEQSLASSLNMDYLQSLLPSPPPPNTDRGLLDEMVADSRVSRRLKSLGYAYVVVTTGFPFIQYKSADNVLGTSDGKSLFQTSLLALTPLPQEMLDVKSAFDSKRDQLHLAFKNLASLAAPTSQPKFVFAHILAPHPPFVFDAEGRATVKKGFYALSDGSHYMQNGGTPETYAKGYSGQLTYLNKLILTAVDGIVKQSPKAIIILQGDHGSKLHLNQDSMADTDMSEVVPIMAAARVPDTVPFPADVMPVNVFRGVFRGLFGDDLPALPRRTFYSTWEQPYQFAEVKIR